MSLTVKTETRVVAEMSLLEAAVVAVLLGHTCADRADLALYFKLVDAVHDAGVSLQDAERSIEDQHAPTDLLKVVEALQAENELLR